MIETAGDLFAFLLVMFAVLLYAACALLILAGAIFVGVAVFQKIIERCAGALRGWLG